MSRFTARDKVVTERSGVPLSRLQSTSVCELTGLSLYKDGHLSVYRCVTRAHDSDEIFVRHGFIFPGELSRQTGGILLGAMRARPRLLRLGFGAALRATETPIYAAAKKRLAVILANPHPSVHIQRKRVVQLELGIALAERD